MKIGIYPKLALSGITKNRRSYIPYILSSVGMIMMFFLIHSISYSPLLSEMRGGASTQMSLSLGKFVIAIFALIFLIYTNSFLISSRTKEFGLYSILGMDKRKITRVIIIESLICAVVSLTLGILLGIAFSKFAELGLLSAIHAEIDYVFRVHGEAIGFTLLIFGVIFAVTTLISCIRVMRLSPLDLMKNAKKGEKPPKVKWFMAILGVILLGVAYYMAISIKAPLKAMTYFFIAVILVIIATYFIFIALSVLLCKILKKDKKYYYKKNHFVSVSNMSFRMGRNGAGLASICILCTMVLVMISTTSSLYLGESSMLNDMYENDNEFEIFLQYKESTDKEILAEIDEVFDSSFKRTSVSPKNITKYVFADFTGTLSGDKISTEYTGGMMMLDDVVTVTIFSADEYKAYTGKDISLGSGEALVSHSDRKYNKETLGIDGVTFKVVGSADEIPDTINSSAAVVPSVKIVVPDYESTGLFTEEKEWHTDIAFRYHFGYDLDVSDDKISESFNDVFTSILDCDIRNDDGSFGFQSRCLSMDKSDFRETYGGLFFLGIMLSIVFIFAAAMIIYYKQITEGNDDKERFSIMKKVGMTENDIKKNINSQLLTVFFAPIVMGGIHLSFAFPMFWKILKLFSLRDITVPILTSIASFAIFLVIYALIYKATTRVYYHIVNEK